MWNPGMNAYESFLTSAMVPANVAYVNVSFRVMQPDTGLRGVGGYLIDDVSVMGVPEPASLLLIALGAVVSLKRRH
jgi:hypothetical protein